VRRSSLSWPRLGSAWRSVPSGFRKSKQGFTDSAIRKFSLYYLATDRTINVV
jgi:hypothetical protein